MNIIEQAVDRVEQYFKNYDTDLPAEILADIIHYCREKGIDIYEEMRLAEQYVDEELAFLEETI